MKRKRWLVGAAVAVAVLVVGVASYAAYKYFVLSSRLRADAEELKAIEAVLDDFEAPVEDGPVDTGQYILLLGNDRREGQGWTRSDTIMIARLDAETHSVSMLSIPRDSYTAVEGHGMTKINHASAYGGPELMIQTVKELTGLPIHHYVEIDFQGFGQVVDALGGVEMTVDEPVVDGGKVLLSPGTQVLSGYEALLFVRNRKAYADGDFSRMRNQQALLFAMVKKASDDTNFARLPGILDSISRHLKTDWTVPELMSVASEYRGIGSDDMRMKTLPGAAQRIDGVSYVVIDEAQAELLYEDLADGGFAAE